MQVIYPEEIMGQPVPLKSNEITPILADFFVLVRYTARRPANLARKEIE